MNAVKRKERDLYAGFTRKNFYNSKKNCNGFTLIELLISIAIIGILTAFGTFAFQNAFGKARDAQRRNDLKQLQTAIQAYYNDYGSYPLTVGVTGCITIAGTSPVPWCGETTIYGGHTSDYIPNLVSKYIRRLPSEPRMGKDNTQLSANCTVATNNGSTYVYTSDGTDYKLIDACGAESPLNNPKDALFDPRRVNTSWAVYSDGATNW